MTDHTTDDTLEERYSDSPEYSITLNRTEYELSESLRSTIEERAEREYAENDRFSCWWRIATDEDESDDETVHESGDPILVIETEGPMVPWSDLDQLNVEMQEAGPDTGMDDTSETKTNDSGNGMQTVDRDEVVDDPDKTIGRTHFEHTPQLFEDLPTPDGEEDDKIPARPTEMPDHPLLIKWLPDHPDITHTWSAGEAIVPTTSWVEWNVQKRADQPRPISGTDDSHDHWESLCQLHDCTVIGELGLSQSPGDNGAEDSQSDDIEDIGGKYQGNNWHV